MATPASKQQFQNFPTPRLDDRTFKDLMDEMRSLIPIYCPEWTNHNPSDPGITLLELFAFLTEVMLYRLNRVPVRNLFSLLDVLGVQPAAPAGSRAVIAVVPNLSAHGHTLPSGTQVASRRTGAGEPLVFETERDLILTTSRLKKVIASSGMETRDVTGQVTGEARASFSPFAGTQEIERYLYLCDGRFLTLREEGMRVHTRFTGKSSYRDLYARWAWQYFNGETWTNARLAVGHGGGEVILNTMPDLEESEVDGVSGPWLRAAPLPSEQEPSEIFFEEIEVEVESVEEGILPDAVFLNPGGESVYSNLDLSRVFYPLGEYPKWESACYVMARELFRAAGTRVELNFVAPDTDAYPRPDPTAELTLKIEYPIAGNRWGLVRSTTPNPFIQSGANRFNLEDDTRALRRGGTLSFIVPEDLQEREIQGIEGPWIRIRLVSGEYRAPQAVTEALEASQRFDIPDPPVGPAFEALQIRSRAPAAPIRACKTYSDFTFMDLWDGTRPRGSSAQLFPKREGYTCALYLGFNVSFPPGSHGIFFKIKDDGEAYEESWEAEIAMQRVRWEFATRDGFVPLPQCEDQTLHLKHDGYLVFQAPSDPEMVELFGESGYWIRGRLSEGRYDVAPMIEDIRLNAVDALNVQTQVENRTLPSDGQAIQEIKLNRAPVLGNVKLWVKEKEPPRTSDDREALLNELGEGVLREESDGIWCRWKQVDHFFRAGPNTRCFRLDPHGGVIQFGDGIHGRIPPPGPRVVRIGSYWIGGGDRGNVGPHTLTILKEGNSLVASVDNPFRSDGGTEAEGLEEAARRGTRLMFSVDRAYRAEDFEVLARQASRRVAKVTCLEPRPVERRLPGRRNEVGDLGDEERVRVIVVPVRDTKLQTVKDKLVPSRELIRRVESYLEARRTLNVKLSVRGPRYVAFSVVVTVYLRGRMSSGVEEDIGQRLYSYLHPLVGGEDGKGWPMGHAVRRVSLFQVASGCPQVLSVLDLKMFDRNGEQMDGSLQLRDDQFPTLTGVKVEAAELT